MLGIILLVIGFVAKIAVLWTIGIIVLVIGAILAVLGPPRPRDRWPEAFVLICVNTSYSAAPLIRRDGADFPDSLLDSSYAAGLVEEAVHPDPMGSTMSG